MLYWLLFVKLQHFVPPFRIFRYLTFRTAFASLTALFTALIVGPLVINRLREFQIGQFIREEGPKAHQKKAGTPTMGGLLIAIAIVVPTLLWADLSNRCAIARHRAQGSRNPPRGRLPFRWHRFNAVLLYIPCVAPKFRSGRERN